MKGVIHKWYWVWDYDKEEKWLNEMAAKGSCLTSVSFCRYVFEDCEPGEYSYRLELLEHNPNHMESQQYLAFLEETGVEQIGSIMSWVYLRKKADAGTFELYSDHHSRIKHLNRILFLLGLLGGYNIFAGIYNLYLLLFMGSSVNSIGFVSLLLGAFIMGGFAKIYRKRCKLEKEQQIFE